MCGFDCPCDPKVCNGGCPGECRGNPFRPSDAQMLAYLEGEHGPPSPEVVDIIQDALVRDAREQEDQG